MKGRWLPFLVTTAALALAVVAPAQDRNRSRGSDDKSTPAKSSGGDKTPPASKPDRSSQPDRSSRPARTSPPERSSPPDRSSRPERTSSSDKTPSKTDRRDSSGDSRPTRRDDSRSGDRDRPSRTDSAPSRSSSDRDSNRNRPERVNSGTANRDRVGSVDYRFDRPVRGPASRSGQVNYGSLHNGYGGARPTRFSTAPSRGTLGEQIRRTRPTTGHNVTFGGTVGGLRVGYVGYSGAWFDDNFCYPFYVFDPWAPNAYCVASPWYRYSYLPAYVNDNRVIVVNGYGSTWGTDGWSSFDYGNQDRRYDALNDSLDDLRNAFERNSTRYAERLLPVTGQVAIYNDGRYDYSIGADDFRDMFLDGVDQSKTIRYVITETQIRGDLIHVRARHEYEDSWGQKQVVYHVLTLQRERDGNVIREFGTE